MRSTSCRSWALIAAAPIALVCWASPTSTYEVARGTFSVDGYQCGDKSSETVIFYPKGDGPFHVVVYGHGLDGHIDGFDDWLQTIASLGLIVVAPYTGHGGSCPEDEDMLLALRASREGGASLHPALASADWSRTGVFGHSMGAKHAPQAAQRAGYNITAMLASHDGTPYDLSNLNVPSMWTTGSADDVATSDAKTAFENCPARPRIYVDLKGAEHMEPGKGEKLNLLDAQFLSCHVSQRQEHCDIIYGSGPDSLCKVHEYTECIVDVDSKKIIV